MALRIATFNVKDLFDATDEASRRNLDLKLTWLAAMVKRLDPDVLGLQEVGSVAVVRELMARAFGGSFAEPLMGTRDARGIGNALVARVPILASRVHTSDQLEFPRFHASDPPPFGGRLPLRRGVVHARVDGGALGEIDVLVAHFKSRRATPMIGEDGAPVGATTARHRAEGELRALVWRASEALFVRGLVDQVAAERAYAKVAVVGDLNDGPESLVVKIVKGSSSDPGSLCASAELVDAQHRYSILHGGAKGHLDHILVSESLRAHTTGAMFLNDQLREHPSVSEPGAPPTVDSDHAPLVACFE